VIRSTVSEAAFADVVENLLTLHGWRWIHYEPAIRQSGLWATPLRGARGFPDYFAIRDGRIIIAEIKRENGRLSRAQTEWIAELERSSVEVYVWRPSDVETINETLRRIPK